MHTIVGHHHVSMLVKDAQACNEFYQKVLGLRRVKMTVNQDDPSMYHLFYGDAVGSPGTELTFFEMPQLGQTHQGTNAITKIGLVLPSIDSLYYWEERLESYKVPHGGVTTYLGRKAIHFTDPDGLSLVFVVSDNWTEGWTVWEQSPVAETHQIRGMGPIEITVRRPKKLVRTLTELFHYKVVKEMDGTIVVRTDERSIQSEIVIQVQDGKRERPGRGSVHHIAMRAKDEAALQHWHEKVTERGFHSTGIIDRYYFKSLYFRESNGVLFEIATDGPGFAVDEPLESIGEHIALPPFLESRREEIVETLAPITNHQRD